MTARQLELASQCGDVAKWKLRCAALDITVFIVELFLEFVFFRFLLKKYSSALEDESMRAGADSGALE